MSNGLDDFTLYIPVRDRHYNLDNITRYYEDLDCRKIVADSSVTEYSDKQKIIDRGFEYIYFGPIIYWKKQHLILKEIDSKFVLDNPDDDIAVKDGIKDCVKFLTENDDFSCAYGEVINAHKKINGRIRLSNRRFDSYAGAIAENLITDNIVERVYCWFYLCLKSLNHSIIRTDIVKEYYDATYNNKIFQNQFITERLLVLLIALRGNFKTLNRIVRIRRKTGDRLKFKHQQSIKELSPNNIDYNIAIPKVYEKAREVFNIIENSDEIYDIVKTQRKPIYRGEKDISHIKSNLSTFDSSEIAPYLD